MCRIDGADEYSPKESPAAAAPQLSSSAVLLGERMVLIAKLFGPLDISWAATCGGGSHTWCDKNR